MIRFRGYFLLWKTIWTPSGGEQIYSHDRYLLTVYAQIRSRRLIKFWSFQLSRWNFFGLLPPKASKLNVWDKKSDGLFKFGGLIKNGFLFARIRHLYILTKHLYVMWSTAWLKMENTAWIWYYSRKNLLASIFSLICIYYSNVLFHTKIIKLGSWMDTIRHETRFPCPKLTILLPDYIFSMYEAY